MPSDPTASEPFSIKDYLTAAAMAGAVIAIIVALIGVVLGTVFLLGINALFVLVLVGLFVVYFFSALKFIRSKRAEETSEMERRPATFTCDQRPEVGNLYYFAVGSRAPGPYRNQRHVEAIIDIADDGTLAGVELIEDMPPPPPQKGAKDE